MAKKKIEVDEDMLKEIMAGDIPIFGRTKQKENAPPHAETKTAEVVETPPEEKPPVAVQEKVSVKPKKRKEDSCDYRKMFLTEGTVQHRQQTYLSQETHNAVRRFLSVVAPNINMSRYIDNIVNAHLEQYRDEMDNLLTNEINNLLNNK